MALVLFETKTRIRHFFHCIGWSQNFCHMHFQCFSFVLKMVRKIHPGIPCFFHYALSHTISKLIPAFFIQQVQIKSMEN